MCKNSFQEKKQKIIGPRLTEMENVTTCKGLKLQFTLFVFVLFQDEKYLGQQRAKFPHIPSL